MYPVNETAQFNSVIFLCVLVAGFCIILLPRKYALHPAIIITLYTTYGQIIEIGPFHFYFLRILIIFGLIRILIRREIFTIKLNSIDLTLLCWITVGFVANMFLWQTQDALIYRLGQTYNVIGVYFFIRAVISNNEDIIRVIKFISIAIMPLAIMIILESYTGQNIFNFMGGVPEFSELRKGIPRAQGTFRHPILAGSFGASSLCMFVGLWFYNHKYRKIALIGISSALILTLASNSSGPLISLIIAIFALTMWNFRRYLKPMLWSIPIILLALHIIMKAPVWNLLTKMGAITGGGGWHRAHLITQAVNHFDEWWFIGTKNTADWMPYALSVNPDSADLTNQFINEGVNGGIISMVLFIAVFFTCFRFIKNALKSDEFMEKKDKFLLWTFGATLSVHIASFFSVSYFDQNIFYFYFLIASISSLNQLCLKTKIIPGQESKQ